MRENIKISHRKSGKWYTKNGIVHREDGPAVEHSDGTKEWYKNGKRHREDGPAIEFPIESENTYYYLYGKWYSEEDFYRVVKLLFLI